MLNTNTLFNSKEIRAWNPNKKLFIIFCLISIYYQTFAQNHTISGQVISADNRIELPLVNVSLLGTDQGTVTDKNGYYRLNISENDSVLVFSHIGYETLEIVIGSKEIISVQLIPTNLMLTNVIITGVADRTDVKNLPFSVGKVNEDLIMKTPGYNAGISLQGKLAGVSVIQPSGLPGTDPLIVLRGVSSLLGSQSPMIIIDGTITGGDGDLADINVDDIESIEVVKGPASSSIYGSRAANGVVNIITKKGAENFGETTITFRNEFGKSFLGDQIELATHHPYLVNADGTVDYSTLSDDQIADNPYTRITNQQSEVFTDGFFMNNVLSIGSTGEKTSFFGSFNNSRQQGVIPLKDGYSRQNIRLNLNHNISNKFKFSATNLYVNSTSDEPTEGARSNFNKVLFMPPDVDLHEKNDEDGSIYKWNVAEPASDKRNPLYSLANQENTLKRNRFIGRYALEYLPLNFLSFEIAYSIDRINASQELFIEKGYLSDDIFGVSNGYLRRDFYSSKYETASLKGTFTKQIGKFNLLAQAFYLYEDQSIEQTLVAGFDFLIDGIKL